VLVSADPAVVDVEGWIVGMEIMEMVEITREKAEGAWTTTESAGMCM